MDLKMRSSERRCRLDLTPTPLLKERGLKRSFSPLSFRRGAGGEVERANRSEMG